jgi:small-conductance mechanosensitive channel
MMGVNTVAQNGTPFVSGITFKQFLDDRDTTGNFTSYNVGHLIQIEDKIDYIHYSEDDDITEIYLESTGTSTDKIKSPHLEFKSDLSSKFKEKEIVEVTFEIMLNETGIESYYYGIKDIDHITVIKDDEEKHGIDILGFHLEFPEQVNFLDNNYGRFLIQFLIWLGIAGLVLIILDPIIRSATKKTITKIDDIILDIIRKPVLILIILYGIVSSLKELELPSTFMYWINGAYSIGFFLMMIWIGFKIFQGVLRQIAQLSSKRKNLQVAKILVPAIQKLGYIAIGFIALSAILGFLQIDLSLFIAGGVVMSMVIAFAAQDTLSNFFSGMFLILEPKFKEDDLIYFEGDTFQVRKIGMRTTQLYDLYKHIDVVMPNNKLANEKLINITEPDRRIKDTVEIGVAYGTDPQKVQDILIELVSKHPDIISEDPNRTPFTRFSEFGDSSLNFKVGFWVRDLDDRFRVKSEINQQLYYRLEKEGIEIPFPQRDIHIRSDETKK